MKTKLFSLAIFGMSLFIFSCEKIKRLIPKIARENNLE